MHGWEIRMLLKHYLEQGVSKAELSRRFGVNPRTIYSWIKTGQLDRDLSAGARVYASRPPVAHKLDPYKGIIDARLEAFPKLSAKRLFDEVRAAGYPGGYERVRDYVRTVRPARAGRGRSAVRDAGRPPGPGGLRDLHASLGPAPCPGDCPRLLPAAVAALLSSTDDAGPDGSAGERLRALWRGSAGAAVRPDARGGAVLATHTCQDNPDLLLSRILLACLAPDIPNRLFGAASCIHRFLPHLRFLQSLR